MLSSKFQPKIKCSAKQPSYLNWDINLKNYIKAVRQYKIIWAKQEKVDWEGIVIDMVRKRIDNIRRKHKRKKISYRKQVLREKIHLDYLMEFLYWSLPTRLRIMSSLFANSIT